jgi:flavin reductase (DIM6/NTAB) family NADH-FMN oxidoreductase RutF
MAGLDPFLAGLDTPMLIVTATHPDTGTRAGCLVGFATQCSIEPDLYAVWLSQRNHTYRVAMAAGVLAVHSLGAGQRDLAELFGTRTGDEVDKFAGVPWRPGPSGVPVLTDCVRYFVGEIRDRAAWGNHTGFLLDPIEVAGEPDPPALTYQAVTDLRAAHPA